MGLTNVEAYLGFSDKVVENAKNVKIFLLFSKNSKGKNYCYERRRKRQHAIELFWHRNDLLNYIVDTTPFKQGLYSPRTHIPVVHPDKTKEEIPDCVFILAWNYADAILKKENDLRKKGVKFIIPVPK